MKKKTNQWFVKHFNDYHDIQSETYKTLELGCFPVKDYGYCRYFGLFYKGKMPSIDKVLERVWRYVEKGEVRHYYTGQDISFDKNQVRNEIYDAIKG